MRTCFIIQPFDRGKFDKRYADIFAPAVQAAGLKPYRVDHDPSVSIPIDKIEAAIRSSEVCLADISTDNPNVWFELGYAIAAQREVILICSDERTSTFPFDVQHRSIIKYSTESSRDFEELRSKIEEKIKATAQRRQKLAHVASPQPVAKLEGLEQHHIAALISVAEELNEPNDSVSAYRITLAMDDVGFTKIATTLALKALIDNAMLESVDDHDDNGEAFTAFRVTDQGMAWLVQNQDKLTLKRQPRPSVPDDDIVF